LSGSGLSLAAGNGGFYWWWWAAVDFFSCGCQMISLATGGSFFLRQRVAAVGNRQQFIFAGGGELV